MKKLLFRTSALKFALRSSF